MVVSNVRAVKHTYAYDPYGNATTASETVSNPFRFDGSVWDSTPKVYKMGARYYDPTAGRWTQMDALAGNVRSPQSLNRYPFVGGDPVLFVDPLGSDISCAAAAQAAGFLGLVETGVAFFPPAAPVFGPLAFATSVVAFGFGTAAYYGVC